MACSLFARAQPDLAHPADEEDLVVHRQPEEHREHEDRHERRQRCRGVDPDELAGPAALEDERHDAVRRGHGEQVHHGRLHCHRDRAERRHQEQHRKQHHATDQQRESLGDVVGAVDRGGRDAADVDGHARAVGGAGQHLVAQAVDQVDGLGVLGARRRDDGHHGRVALGVEGRWRHAGYSAGLGDGGRDLVEGAGRRTVRHLGHEEEGAVHAGAETRRPACRRPAGCWSPRGCCRRRGTRSGRRGTATRAPAGWRPRRSRPRCGGGRRIGSSPARPAKARRDRLRRRRRCVRARWAGGAGRRACRGSPAGRGRASRWRPSRSARRGSSPRPRRA